MRGLVADGGRREMRQIWKGNQRRDETEDGYLVI